jgi:hypothetical protein
VAASSPLQNSTDPTEMACEREQSRAVIEYRSVFPLVKSSLVRQYAASIARIQFIAAP